MIENRRVESNLDEPRNGIGPFYGNPSQEIIEDGVYQRVTTADIDIGTLGKGLIYLGKPKNEQMETQISQDDQAFTIDLSGEIHTGRLRDFINAGYYMMGMGIISITETRQQLSVNVWINQREPVFSADIHHFGLVSTSRFSRTIDGTRQSFVLPNSPAILQALRLSISTKE